METARVHGDATALIAVPSWLPRAMGSGSLHTASAGEWAVRKRSGQCRGHENDGADMERRAVGTSNSSRRQPVAVWRWTSTFYTWLLIMHGRRPAWRLSSFPLACAPCACWLRAAVESLLLLIDASPAGRRSREPMTRSGRLLPCRWAMLHGVSDGLTCIIELEGPARQDAHMQCTAQRAYSRSAQHAASMGHGPQSPQRSLLQGLCLLGQALPIAGRRRRRGCHLPALGVV